MAILTQWKINDKMNLAKEKFHNWSFISKFSSAESTH